MSETPSPLLRMARNTTGLAMVVLFLAGCTVDYTAPNNPLPATFSAPAPERDVTRGQQWWSAFNDARLNQLLTAGLARNLSVAQAVEAINEARATLRLRGAEDLPNATLGASAQRGQQETAGGLPAPITESSSVTGSVSWTLDLFGRNRNARAAASAQLDAAYLSVDVARLTMMSEIAQSYITARYYQEAINLTRQSIQSRRESLELTQTQVEYGSAPRLDLVQAQQLVAQAEAQLPSLEVGFDQSVNSLGTLTNQSIASLKAILQRGGPQPRPRYRASVGVPAEAIRNRPDVIVAERQYAASVFTVGVARAAFFPSLSLTGTVTPTNISGGNSFKTWSFGPQLNLPIFNAANNANLSIAESQAVQQRLSYESTVLDAIEEVENALAAYNRDVRNVEAQRRVVNAAQEAVDLSRTSFEIGDTEFFTVLDAERTLLEGRNALAQAIQQQGLNYVRLSVATAGAGIGPRAAVPATAPAQVAAN